MNRVIFIVEDIVSSSGENTGENSLVGRVTSQLIEMSSESVEEPIHVLMDTDGGNMKTALSLFDLFKASPAPIYTYGLSEICSAGVLIFIAGEKRYAMPHSQFMMHPSTLNVSGSTVDFKSTSETLKKQGKIVKDLFVESTKMSSKKFEELHSRTNYMWAAEAKQVGIITDIIDKLPSDLLKPQAKTNVAEAAVHLQGLAEIIGKL